MAKKTKQSEAYRAGHRLGKRLRDHLSTTEKGRFLLYAMAERDPERFLGILKKAMGIA